MLWFASSPWHVIIVGMKEAYDALGGAAPVVAISLFALPAYIGVIRQRGFLRGVAILLALGAFIIGFMTLVVAVAPGNLSFGGSAGPKLFGTTPWLLALAYPPLLLAAYWLASKFTHGFMLIFLTALLFTGMNVVLDPAIARVGIAQWEHAGSFYGIPLLNFALWFVGGMLGSWLLHILWGASNEIRASVAYSGLAVLLFWTGVNIGVEQWGPMGVGAFASLVILLVLILEKRQIRREQHAA